MRLFALIIFGIHTLFELVFGASAYLSGASSSQTAEAAAAQSVAMTISFRFLGSALIAMGVLGAIVLFRAGVTSVAAKYVAAGFAVFHGLGALGSLYTAAPDFAVYANPLSLGAVVLHGLLAIGFAIIAAGLRRAVS